MILARYITKELLLHFLIVIAVLLFITISNQFVGSLAKSASGQLPFDLVLKVVALYIPELFATLAPLAFFIALLFSLGKLHADSEMVVMLTSGFHWAKLVKITYLIALPITLLIAYCTLFLVPSIIELREETLASGKAMGIIQAVTPGRFHVLDSSNVVFYVEDKEPGTGKLQNVFIAEQPVVSKPKDNQTMMVAQTAHLQNKDNKGQFFLELQHGHRYTGHPGSAQYEKIDFTTYGREVQSEPEPLHDFQRLRPSNRLWQSNLAGDKAELHWRLSIPVILLVLAMLGIPLAKVQPRQGRFAKFLPAILIFIVYLNLLTVCKRWIINQTLNSVGYLWAIHLIFFIFGCLLLAQASGRLSQFFAKKARAVISS